MKNRQKNKTPRKKSTGANETNLSYRVRKLEKQVLAQGHLIEGLQLSQVQLTTALTGTNRLAHTISTRITQLVAMLQTVEGLDMEGFEAGVLQKLMDGIGVSMDDTVEELEKQQRKEQEELLRAQRDEKEKEFQADVEARVEDKDKKKKGKGKPRTDL